VTPPCIWTFLSSLGENKFFSKLLAKRDAAEALASAAREGF
jgi:hypothetical protein